MAEDFKFNKIGIDIFDIVGMYKDITALPTYTPTKMSDQIRTDGTNGDVYIYSNDLSTWIKLNDASDKIDKSIGDAKGDLIGFSADNTPARLAVGSNDQVLTADSGETTGIKWTTPDTVPIVNKFLGIGEAESKSYINYHFPFIYNESSHYGALWTINNITPDKPLNSHFWGFSASLDAKHNLITAVGVAHDLNIGSNTPKQFNDAGDLFVEFKVKTGISGDESMAWGFMADNTPCGNINDQTIDACCFVIGADEKLYAHTSNAGVGNTNTEITGITLSSLNTYRIEWNPGVNAKFYVNGTLKATNTTNLPDGANTILWAVGAGGTDGNSDEKLVTAPYFSLEI